MVSTVLSALTVIAAACLAIVGMILFSHSVIYGDVRVCRKAKECSVVMCNHKQVHSLFEVCDEPCNCARGVPGATCRKPTIIETLRRIFE